MNYGELKVAVAAWAHRTDIDPQMDLFVQNVSEDLGRRFGVMPAPLVIDSDTNSLLTTHAKIYLYGALREQATYTQEIEAVQAYDALYEKQIREMNINYRGLDWDACPSPVMAPVIVEAT